MGSFSTALLYREIDGLSAGDTLVVETTLLCDFRKFLIARLPNPDYEEGELKSNDL